VIALGKSATPTIIMRYVWVHLMGNGHRMEVLKYETSMLLSHHCMSANASDYITGPLAEFNTLQRTDCFVKVGDTEIIFHDAQFADLSNPLPPHPTEDDLFRHSIAATERINLLMGNLHVEMSDQESISHRYESAGLDVINEMIASDPALLIQMQKLKARNYKLNSAATGMGGMLVQDLLTRGVLSDVTSFDELRKAILTDASTGVVADPRGDDGIAQDIPTPPPPALFEDEVGSTSQRVYSASRAYAQVILEWALVLYKPPSMLTTAPLGNVLMSNKRIAEPSHQKYKPAAPVPTDALVGPFPILRTCRATLLSMIEHRAVPDTIRMWSEYFFCTHASYQAVCMASTCKSLPLCVIGLKMAVTSYYLSGQRAYYESIIRQVSYLLYTTYYSTTFNNQNI
jgi:hypothetical protein